MQKPPPTEGVLGSGDLARQRLLLEQARVALSRGDAATALAGLAEHERLYPQSQLVEERELLRIQALQRAGDYAEVRHRAAAFEEKFPKSMFIPLVHSVLEQLP
jgi:outer membrane protein assembly factor BamD (BamD/ComL family)